MARKKIEPQVVHVVSGATTLDEIRYRQALDEMKDPELEDEYAKLLNQIAVALRKQEPLMLELLHRGR